MSEYGAGERQGSTFVLNLPVMAIQSTQIEVVGAQVSGPRHGAGGDPESLRKLRVLVVDDEFDARQLVHRMLTDVGAIVTVASSASDAMDVLRGERLEILVSDIGMPGEDGHDFLRKVRSEFSASELPAASLTAFARSEDRKWALLAGFQTHVSKPVDPSELVAVVAVSPAGPAKTRLMKAREVHEQFCHNPRSSQDLPSTRAPC